MKRVVAELPNEAVAALDGDPAELAAEFRAAAADAYVAGFLRSACLLLGPIAL